MQGGIWYNNYDTIILSKVKDGAEKPVRYLFFDLEYATSSGGNMKICEFGYVITNENFKVIERNNLIINPNISRREWDYRVVEKILTRKIEEYEKGYTFRHYYSKIAALINNADMVLGHTLDSDAKAINDDCQRYDLPSIDYDFYDIKTLYKHFSNENKARSVTSILEELNIEGDPKEHDAEADAFNTMLALKTMVEMRKTDIKEFVNLYPDIKDSTENYVIKSVDEFEQKRKSEFLEHLNGDGTNDITNSSINKSRYRQFIDNVKPQTEFGAKFYKKKVSISTNYAAHHYKEILNLIQLIVNEGGTVTIKVSESDIFVKYEIHNEDGTPIDDIRLERVLEENQNGGSIEIIDLKELLARLEITEEELEALPPISFEFLFDDDAIIRDKKDKKIIDKIVGRTTAKTQKSGGVVYSSGEIKTTIGDLFGDILSKI